MRQEAGHRRDEARKEEAGLRGGRFREVRRETGFRERRREGLRLAEPWFK